MSLKDTYNKITEDWYKGTIIEQSLADKSILNAVKIVKKYQLEDWTLYDVLVTESQTAALSKALAEGPWYIHIWQEGKDDVRVIFKGKFFDIKFSDKATWGGAVSHGKTIGIPDEQLDFLID